MYVLGRAETDGAPGAETGGDSDAETGGDPGTEAGGDPGTEADLDAGSDRDGETHRPPHTARIGSFLARDGSAGASVGVDLDRPHAGVVFGKRGTGKSYTLGVLAEELADADGVAPVVVDPMGVFAGLEAVGGRVVDPAVRPASIPPSEWPDLLALDPASGPGSLVWRVVADAVDDGNGDAVGADGSADPGRSGGPSPSLAALREAVDAADALAETRRAAVNHLRLAASWGVFDADAPPVASLAADGDPAVLDLAGVPDAAAAAVVRAVARGLYDARIDGGLPRLPWLLVDEAHAFFDGIAEPALRTLLTRGRAPGVSLVCATQRPAALPSVAVSQSDLLVSHRLTAARDVDRLAEAEATYLAGDLASRLPEGIGEALVVDDATETVHTVRIRERRTPHEGESPRASRLSGPG
ncbi:ATP-binding protein [Halorubrum sp. SP9]|uniref:ATP-binding protein n=1 Tax=Halorubrum sp. SP9 TaxID=1537267 RepID=UPI003741FD39